MLEHLNLTPDAFADREPGARAVCRAVNITSVFSGTDTIIRDIEATADADTTTGNIAHGLGAAPAEVYLTPLAAAAAISLWRVTTNDATNLVVQKSTTAGSGAAGVQVRLIAKRPHTLGR